MPVPTIFLIDNNNAILEMKDEPYDSEERLQTFLANYPSVLAGDQMNPNAPVKWLLVKREAGVPGEDGGRERWAVDHLFIDQNGVPTFVEVKRSTDTRIRREVVGQMLDYAANAVEYWPIDTIRQWFEETCRTQQMDPNMRLGEVLGTNEVTDDVIARFWGTVETNLRAGKMRLVFAADEIPPELRRIIEFLDERMTPTEVLGIEIRQYVGTNVRTLVPSVVRSSRRVTASNGPTAVRWDRESFLSSLLQRRGADSVSVAKQILDWASTHEVKLWWGQGRIDGSCFLGTIHEGATYYPAAIWTYGRVQLQFQNLQQKGVSSDLNEALRSRLNAIPGIHIGADDKFPSFEMTLLKEPQPLSAFLSAVGSFMDQIKTATTKTAVAGA
jgi:hypothetical protein